MANLRTALDSAFWDQPLSSPQTLEGCARSIPGDPFPLDATRASRALRIQQLSLLANGFPLGLVPSYSSASPKHPPSLSVQSLLLKLASSNCWLGLIGQFRPKKLISSIKAEFSNAEELELSVFRDAAKHIVDKSLYSIGICSQFSPTPSTSLLLSTERHGHSATPRYKFMLFHQLPSHDITLEAAWPELFLDHRGGYWDVPQSISLDMASIGSDTGFRYRFGIHKNNGHPNTINAINDQPPFALMPGLCGKASFSYEKSKDLWRKKQSKKDSVIKTDRGSILPRSYDVRLSQPHSAISGIVGGACAAWFGGRDISVSADGHNSSSTRKRSPLNADLFGSVCYTFQHGNFTKLYGDLTRIDARLDICSALTLAKRAFRWSSVSDADNALSSPRLNLTLQQQVAGPIVFRVDSRFSLDSSSDQEGPHVEDLVYSLSYSLRLLRSGKVVAWYSPKRKEGMVELRLFEF
ncbi:protein TRIGALACTOSYLDIACYLGLYCEROL 4, chloroplastic isoform X1 [Ricinus communis]|uniref:protein TRIGALACTOSYLDIACYLGLYCEROL 4, chloroplastic isoform X1 n=1 Tax=Ricinus communis TaxID=3988 RepID=UPI00201A4129|nr:protein TRIGALACTOSYLDIACYLGLYCEROL 4, chloroplastic isoform X1 [Ricinus communis]